MIKVTFCKNRDGEITEFETMGHAGFDVSGRDIVCAAVSILVINTINSIEAFTDTSLEVESSDDVNGEARIFARVVGDVSNEATVLLKALELGLTGTAKSNPDYISITYKEV